ncbi:ATP-binding protein [Sphingomonas sp. MMS24-J13]|uniref:ATP-binding protein n=1 Tax=Sphingomonas sp. MMS24-J13 TaxID=3238686 RepID=UPI00384DD553
MDITPVPLHPIDCVECDAFLAHTACAIFGAQAFERFFGMTAPAGLADLRTLTLGDFAVVTRQRRFATALDGAALVGDPQAGASYASLPEVERALRGLPATMLRRNRDYHRTLPIEWLSRSANLRMHHARPIVIGGKVVGVLLLARSPPPLYMGLYRDAGKNSRQAGGSHCAIEVRVTDKIAQILVTDDGPGIAAADRERLFEPFFTTRRAKGGTGLGLPIARSLLDACGGSIRLVESTAGCTIAIGVPIFQARLLV